MKTSKVDHTSPSRGRRIACRLIAGLSALALCACSGIGGPSYKRPDVAEKEHWSEAPEGVSPEATIQPEWWTGFGDPYLNELIDKAISGNVDLRILAARTGVAGAAIEQARAGLLPTIEGGAGTDTFKSTGTSRTTQYSTASEMSWELDIWGKTRKGVAAQTADYKATEADWRAGYLSLVADTASAYFQIRQLDEQIDRQQITLKRNRQILSIYQSMHDEGLVPRTQVLQQEAEINRLQNELLDLQRLRKITENGLATLLGIPADDLKVPNQTYREPLRPIDVPGGLPSELLSRRPDIIAAEYRLLQAHNLEAQSRLARLPSIGLTSRAGSASFALTDLLKSWTFGLSSVVSFPVFDPNVAAQIKVSEAQTQVAVEEYRRTVIGAFEEVENSLTNLSSHKAQREELLSRRDKLSVVSDQVYAQLEEGMVSQLEIFEVERTLLDAEQAMLANHWQILTDNVTLFKALGGGWSREVVGLSSK